MKFKGIHHIAIIGSNYKKFKHFYIDLLGARVIRENYREQHAVGIKTEEPRIDEFTGKKMTFFFDPDGLPLEIHE